MRLTYFLCTAFLSLCLTSTAIAQEDEPQPPVEEGPYSEDTEENDQLDEFEDSVDEFVDEMTEEPETVDEAMERLEDEQAEIAEEIWLVEDLLSDPLLEEESREFYEDMLDDLLQEQIDNLREQNEILEDILEFEEFDDSNDLMDDIAESDPEEESVTPDENV